MGSLCLLKVQRRGWLSPLSQTWQSHHEGWAQQRWWRERERGLRGGCVSGRVLLAKAQGCSPSILDSCFSVIRHCGWTTAYRLVLPQPHRPLSRTPCLPKPPCPAWHQPGLLSCSSPQGCPHKPSPSTKGQCRWEGGCYAVRMAARPTWLLGGQITEEWPRPGWLGQASRLFFVFVGFEPLPQKEVGEGQSDAWPGEMRYICQVSG